MCFSRLPMSGACRGAFYTLKFDVNLCFLELRANSLHTCSQLQTSAGANDGAGASLPGGSGRRFWEMKIVSFHSQFVCYQGGMNRAGEGIEHRTRNLWLISMHKISILHRPSPSGNAEHWSMHGSNWEMGEIFGICFRTTCTGMLAHYAARQHTLRNVKNY